MNPPDKIYVREYPDGIARFWEEKKKDDVVATIPHEYIRKDALLECLEKVAAEYKKRSDEGELVWQNMCGINEAIKILNEM
jgi:hypothetical protein